MSVKRCDTRNRWRNKTIAFRMSPEEADQLDKFVRLSGLTKQDYLICRTLQRDVVVHGNPRVHKALRNQLADVLEELRRIQTLGSEDDELLEMVAYSLSIIRDMQNQSD
ncbi:hypothetical protein LJC56_05990 [Christensenellaceae bacterium OttesenSCG-928-K19]|nr:hypothetical protein [Christensenellaceae bacterium OttesenSCG-928-K19]